MKALITGIEGFTGRYLADALTRSGYQVFGISRTPTDVKSVSRSFVADLNNATLVQQVVTEIEPDIIAHLAAISFVPHGNVEEIYRTNVLGTRNLLEALSSVEKKCKSILLASSANVYGNTRTGELTEDLPPAPANDYAVTKLTMEYMANLYQDRLPIIIARPFNYTGIGQADHFLIPKIVGHFGRREAVIQLGNLDVARDFSDVRTVVDIYRRLLESPAAIGKTLNVCSGQAHTLMEVLDTAMSITGHTIEVKVNPDFVRENEVKLLLGNRSRLETSIGPITDIPLRETLQWMLNPREQ